MNRLGLTVYFKVKIFFDSLINVQLIITSTFCSKHQLIIWSFESWEASKGRYRWQKPDQPIAWKCIDDLKTYQDLNCKIEQMSHIADQLKNKEIAEIILKTHLPRFPWSTHIWSSLWNWTVFESSGLACTSHSCLHYVTHFELYTSSLIIHQCNHCFGHHYSCNRCFFNCYFDDRRFMIAVISVDYVMHYAVKLVCFIIGLVCCIYPLLQRFSQHEPFKSAPDNSNWHCVGVYTPKRYRQLQVKDLQNFTTCQDRAGFEPTALGRQALTLPMRHHAREADQDRRLYLSYQSYNVFSVHRICHLWLSAGISKARQQRKTSRLYSERSQTLEFPRNLRSGSTFISALLGLACIELCIYLNSI